MVAMTPDQHSILAEAREVGHHKLMLYSGPTLRRIIAGLVDIIDSEQESKMRADRAMCEALNSGDGSYRP